MKTLMKLCKRVRFEIQYFLLRCGLHPRYEVQVYGVHEDGRIALEHSSLDLPCWTQKGAVRLAYSLVSERTCCFMGKPKAEVIHGKRVISVGDSFGWFTFGDDPCVINGELVILGCGTES